MEKSGTRLPSFLVIGAPKSGTTSLFHYMMDHPAIFAVRDANYFSYSEARKSPSTATPTLEEYSALFERAPGEAVLGDVSGSYLYSEVAPKNIRTYIPKAKLIVSLRNPVERAYSNYKMLIRMSGDKPRVPEAVGMDDGWVTKSFYYSCLKRYYDLFGVDNIRVILFDDFANHMGEIVRGLYGFVGVDPDFEARTDVRYNPGGQDKAGSIRGFRLAKSLLRPIKPYLSKAVESRLRHWNAIIENGARRDEFPPLPEKIRHDLLELYLPDIQKIEKLTNMDYSCWMEDGS